MTKSTVSYHTITAHDVDQRIDNYLIKCLKGVPKSHIYRIIRDGEVRVNKKRVKVNTRVQVGDIVRLPPVRYTATPKAFVGQYWLQQLQHSILFENDQFLVLNKPAGIAVHGGSGLSFGVIEAMRKLREDLSYLELIHRLDKETSGCLLLAKKRSALRAIHALWVEHQVEKIYWAILMNQWQFPSKTLTVEAPLRKNQLQSGERMVVVDNQDGKPSQTQLILKQNFSNGCWVEARLLTGRTHQIRVHCAHIGHPILGDQKYAALTASMVGHDERLLDFFPNPTAAANCFVDSVLESSCTDLYTPVLCAESPRTSLSAAGLERSLFLHARSIAFELQGQHFLFEAEPDELFIKTISTGGI